MAMVHRVGNHADGRVRASSEHGGAVLLRTEQSLARLGRPHEAGDQGRWAPVPHLSRKDHMMQYTKVVSSNVDEIAHDGHDLFVRFKNGGLYKYRGVPLSVFERMLKADSVGKFLNAEIK